MEVRSQSTNIINETPPRVSELRRFFRVFLGRGLVKFGVAIILIFVIVAIFAPVISPYSPYATDYSQSLAQPSWHHFLGTDAPGRDVLSRLFYGARTSLMIGLVVVAIASIIGMTLGLIAGFYGGWTFTIIMRIIDALMCFPMILLALLVAALLGGGIRNVIIALSFALMPGYARLMCGQVLSVKSNDFVLAERSIGANNLRIMFRHILPSCFPPLIVQMTLMLGATILAEAGLSFLGIGIQAPTATWGSMVNDGRNYLLTNPILSFAPGLAIMLIVYAFNMVGDGLRDALDPRLRGVL